MFSFAMPVFWAAMTIVIVHLSAARALAVEGWSNEAEAAVVTTAGNTETESYSAKQKTTYTQEVNSYILSGRYLQTKTSGIETAKSWDASLRYEREISPLWSTFVAYGAEADPYAGFIQRNNADLGAKYFFIKSEKKNFFSELGYRLTSTYQAGDPAATPPVIAGPISENFGRLYLEYAQAWNEALSFKMWVEYLPNFTHSAASLLNAEPSVNVMLTSVFSLKMAYLAKYRNEVPTGAKNSDTTFTTSIVAKF